MFKVVYHQDVVGQDLPKISSAWQHKVRAAIEAKLTSRPELYGKPLRRSLKNYRKLRVGDYRVIFRIEGTLVKVFIIQHRSTVYSHAGKRL